MSPDEFSYSLDIHLKMYRQSNPRKSLKMTGVLYALAWWHSYFINGIFVAPSDVHNRFNNYVNCFVSLATNHGP